MALNRYMLLFVIIYSVSATSIYRRGASDEILKLDYADSPAGPFYSFSNQGNARINAVSITDNTPAESSGFFSSLIEYFFEFWKLVLIILIFIILAVCVFGGGGLFWYAKKNDLKPADIVNEMGEVIDKAKDIKGDFTTAKNKAREKRRASRENGKVHVTPNAFGLNDTSSPNARAGIRRQMDVNTTRVYSTYQRPLIDTDDSEVSDIPSIKRSLLTFK